MPSKLAISPPPTDTQDLTSFNWKSWFNNIFNRIGNSAFGINGFSKTSLPTATDWASNVTSGFSGLIYVYDEAGGPTLAFSDGTNWRRVQDRAVVS